MLKQNWKVTDRKRALICLFCIKNLWNCFVNPNFDATIEHLILFIIDVIWVLMKWENSAILVGNVEENSGVLHACSYLYRVNLHHNADHQHDRCHYPGTLIRKYPLFYCSVLVLLTHFITTSKLQEIVKPQFHLSSGLAWACPAGSSERVWELAVGGAGQPHARRPGRSPASGPRIPGSNPLPNQNEHCWDQFLYNLIFVTDKTM